MGGRLAVLGLSLLLAGCGSHDSSTGPTGEDQKFLVDLNAQFNDGRTVRWGTLPIPVFTNGIARPDEVTAWASATGAVSFAFVGSPPANGISFRTGSGSGICGQTTVEFGDDGRITSADVQIVLAVFRTPLCVATVSHETGHGIGFLAHTTDGGLMDPDGGNGQITPGDVTFVRALYALAPGTAVGAAERLRIPLGRSGRRSMTFVDPVRR